MWGRDPLIFHPHMHFFVPCGGVSDDGKRWIATPSTSKTTKTRTVDGVKFVRGFLQHTLPKGFLKVRYYGWMASNSRTTYLRLKASD